MKEVDVSHFTPGKWYPYPAVTLGDFQSGEAQISDGNNLLVISEWRQPDTRLELWELKDNSFLYKVRTNGSAIEISRDPI